MSEALQKCVLCGAEPPVKLLYSSKSGFKRMVCASASGCRQRRGKQKRPVNVLDHELLAYWKKYLNLATDLEDFKFRMGEAARALKEHEGAS